jgi:amino acid adenylation domain-containing protein
MATTVTTAFDFFANTLAKWPDAIALEAGGETLTYAELGAAAARTAAALTEAAPEPPRRVAICADRTGALYSGYLALQALGLCVVPIDLKYPAERCLDVLFRCGVNLVLVDAGGRQFFEAIEPEDRPRLVDIPKLTRTPMATTLFGPGQGNPESEAYVLFTSGSTGRPKGVPIKQRNFTPLVQYMINRYALVPGCRLAQTFGQVFDPFMANLFAVWGAGATLVDLTGPEVRNIATTIEAREITHWFSVCSAISLAQAVGELGAGKAPGLIQAIFGGETFTLNQAKLWRAMAPRARIFNVYGPTETVVTCADTVIDPFQSDWPTSDNGTVPIGAVYDHLECAVIDESGFETDEGELCIRGSQRFDGYLEEIDNDSRFYTFERGSRALFITTPRPGPRDWYRTGDRVQKGPHGMVHCGRIDKQMKLLGHRIEPGEIEAIMRRHPNILDAVVVKSQSNPETLHAAYTGRETDKSMISDWLREFLPAYMVPGSFRFYQVLPQSLVGKIDRNAIEAAS